MVSSFPFPLTEEPRCGYSKDNMLTGLYQCTIAENLRYPLAFLTKSITRNHQTAVSAKTSSTHLKLELIITKGMTEVREASPGEREHLP